MTHKDSASSPASSKPKAPRAKAKLKGSGAIAQGKGATAAAKRAVIIAGDNAGRITTGDTTYQTIIQQATRPGATPQDLRRAYLAWLSARANELPLLAGEGGAQVQLSSVYTALLTQTPDVDETAPRTGGAATLQIRAGSDHAADRELPKRSALEALNAAPKLVLMGGPGSGKSTFLNFVALCMAGELLGVGANLQTLRQPIPPDDVSEAKKKPKPQRWAHKALLPVRVVLRDFAADLPAANVAITADTLWRFILKQLPEQLNRFGEDLQAELLRKGGLILLDGLDEVPDAQNRREQVKQAVQAFCDIYPRCRFLVTSRTYAYQKQDWKLNGFAEAELLHFTPGQIARFIQGWYAHMAALFRLTQADADVRAEALQRATQREDIRELAERPLLLTLMARLHTKGGGSLPENREALYAQSVDMLLGEWEGLKLKRDEHGKPVVAEPSLSEWLNASRDAIRKELDKLAYSVHRNQPDLKGTADIRQDELVAALMAATKDRADTKLMRLEEFLRDRAGLFNSHGEGLYQFPHRSFQEYLAACHLARYQYPDELSKLVKHDPNRWREVTLLAAAISKQPSPVWELVDELCAKDDAPAAGEPLDGVPAEPAPAAQWGALLAAQVLDETGLAAPDPNLQDRHERKRLRVRDWQICLLRSSSLPARERALAGRLLNTLGDPRAHIMQVDAMRFCWVPPGPFWMGEEGEYRKDGKADLHLNETLTYGYWMGQAPVTTAQFAEFVRESGYQPFEKSSYRGTANCPAVLVTWYDARAFCDWLTTSWRDHLPSGWGVQLPNEPEWEKTARGGLTIPAPASVQITSLAHGFARPQDMSLEDNPFNQREFPWGSEFDEEAANCERNIGRTSTPGCFVHGRGPYGCDDLAGNVWEWTRSVYQPYPYVPTPQREDAQNNESRVLRGGSWSNSQRGARCAYRFSLDPGYRDYDIGFRVVLLPLFSSSAPASGL